MPPRSPYQHRVAMGQRGETAAAKYLFRQGHRILERNLRNPAGEIDLITEDHGTIVFVEVKTRAEGSPHDGLDAVDSTKRMQICRAASYYLSEFREKVVMRFDIVVVSDGDSVKAVDIKHYPDAFQPAGATDIMNLTVSVSQ